MLQCEVVVYLQRAVGVRHRSAFVKVLHPLVELAIKKSDTSAEKLLCMVYSYEYWYRAQDIGSNMPSQMQRGIEA